ncbi:MAG: RNA 2',3'-cyclic phosphodiesterase [Oscillospiraceae bacterium]|nr:RNA 2',3'-cyclic phosphodiesterase [Oscillospiraceae bacterium]
MRMFYAIKFENGVKEELEKNLIGLRARMPRGSFTEKENFHVTLAFVGEVKPEKIGDLKKAAENTVIKLNPPSIKIKIEGLGTFARPGDELLWAGVKTEPENILGEINKAITGELAGFGIRLTGNDKFHPHVTLARKAEFYEDSKTALAKMKFAPIEFSADSITLMESSQKTETYGQRRYWRIVYNPIHETKF